MTPVNPDWARRGKVCRDRRVHGTRYRTQGEQAEAFGLALAALSKMENGQLDPAPLERAWGVVPGGGADGEGQAG